MRFRRGWRLTKKSWELVGSDARLLVFPTASALVAIAAGISMFVLAHGRGWLGYLIVFGLFTFPLTVVGAYLGVAFVALGRRALDGEETSLRQGFRCANERLPAIVAWSLLATVVGLLLQALRELRGGWLATRIAGGVLGVAWAAATFFVLPVIALEDAGAVTALRRSARLVRERWGETVAGVVSLGGVFVLALSAAAAAVGAGVAIGFTPPGIALVAAGVVAFACVIAYTSTAGHMFQLVLYRYATTGEAAGAFTAAELDAAFRERPLPRVRRWLRRR
jgi:hypothetical protein